MGINYGFNKVRLTERHTLEIQVSEKPAAVAEMIGRYFF